MLSIHLPNYISIHALSYSVIIINQSIHINLSAGAQNITGTYIIVTVHAKTSLVCTKIEIHFFTPAYSYIH